MSQKIWPCSAEEQPEREQSPNPCQFDRPSSSAPGRRNKTEPGQRNADSASSSPESNSLNGDGKRNGKSQRRKKRSADPEEGAAEGSVKTEEKKADGQLAKPSAGLMGLQHECTTVWFERSAYERAESLYQCWLASSSNGSMQSARATPPEVACRHGDQVACHHVVEEVWVNKTTFDQAERRFAEVFAQPPVPNSLDLPSLPDHLVASRTPDEGYQSLAPTPVVQQGAATAATPTRRQSINGLPRIPVELLRDVWLEKPLYDRAEAAFYQNLYGNNASKRPGCSSSSSRGGDHPQSLVEEEEEEEEEEEVAKKEVTAVEEKRVVQQGKAEIFHALHPIQEEEEPAEVVETDKGVGGVCCFLHPDSERVWLDKWRYDAAESRFHGYGGKKDVVVGKKGRRPGADMWVASSAPLRQNTMSSVDFLIQDKIWFDKPRYDEAERRFYEHMNGHSQPAQEAGANTILQDIARARENIQKSLAGLKKSLSQSECVPPTMSAHFSTSTSTSMCSSSGAAAPVAAAGDKAEIISRIKSLELENHSLHKVVDHLQAALFKLECRVAVLEKSPATVATPPAPPSVPYTNGTSVQQKIISSAPAEEEEEEDEDEDMDLFGSDDDDEEAEKLKEQRLKEYAERKAKKPSIIAKSSILLDVKPWDDETDMAKLEECVRSIQAEGLLWGTSKLVPVGYGIKKLQIACVVEDDKVGTDMLEEEITKFEDFIQSVDVAAFNKI